MEEVTVVEVEDHLVERTGFHQAGMAGPTAVEDRGETVDLIIRTEMCQLVNGEEGKDYQIVDLEEDIEGEERAEIGELSCILASIETQRWPKGPRSKNEL